MLRWDTDRGGGRERGECLHQWEERTNERDMGWLCGGQAVVFISVSKLRWDKGNAGSTFFFLFQDLWVLTTPPALRPPSRPWMASRLAWKDWKCNWRGPKMPTAHTEWPLRGGRRNKKRWGGRQEVMNDTTTMEVGCCCMLGEQEEEMSLVRERWSR